LRLNVPDRYAGHRACPHIGYTRHGACPHIWAPQPAWAARPGLGQVHRAKSSVAQIPCLSPYPAHHAPFQSPHLKLRVEPWTLNVPDRYPGHRVRPHIWAPQPASTIRPAAGEPRRRKTPVAQTACLSPYPAHHPPFRSPLCTLRVKRWTLNVPYRYPGHRACPHIGYTRHGACPHIWAPQPAWAARPGLGQVHRAKSSVAQIPCLSPYPAHHAPFQSPHLKLRVEPWTLNVVVAELN